MFFQKKQKRTFCYSNNTPTFLVLTYLFPLVAAIEDSSIFSDQHDLCFCQQVLEIMHLFMSTVSGLLSHVIIYLFWILLFTQTRLSTFRPAVTPAFCRWRQSICKWSITFLPLVISSESLAWRDRCVSVSRSWQIQSIHGYVCLQVLAP